MLGHCQRHYAKKETVYQETVKCLQESCGHYPRIHSFYQKELQERGNERAALASRASAIEAVHSVREQEAQAQLKVMSAFIQKTLGLKYTDEISRLRVESSFHSQQRGALQQQLQQVRNLHLQMKEHFGKEAHNAFDEVVAKAAKREAQFVAGIQAGTVEPLLKQQLEQALGDVETA